MDKNRTPTVSNVNQFDAFLSAGISPGSKTDDSIEPVNIGFKADLPKRAHKAVRRPELELLARRRQLKVVSDEIHNQDECCESPFRRFLAAEHYGIFKDLFGPHHYFIPILDVPVFYPIVNSSDVVPVYYGNQISPGTAMVFVCCFPVNGILSCTSQL